MTACHVLVTQVDAAMPKKLWGEVFTPADLEEATNGYVDRMTQRNFVRRQLFTAPIPEPKAGKPRQFPLVSVYEAAIMACALHSGLSLWLAQQAIEDRMLQAGGAPAGEAGPGGYDACIARGANPGGMPEFDETDLPDPWLWVIRLHPWIIPPPDDDGAGGIVDVVCVVKPNELGEAMQRCEWSKPISRYAISAHLLNITEIVADVDQVLLERLERRG